MHTFRGNQVGQPYLHGFSLPPTRRRVNIASTREEATLTLSLKAVFAPIFACATGATGAAGIDAMYERGLAESQDLERAAVWRSSRT